MQLTLKHFMEQQKFVINDLCHQCTMNQILMIYKKVGISSMRISTKMLMSYHEFQFVFLSYIAADTNAYFYTEMLNK